MMKVCSETQEWENTWIERGVEFNGKMTLNQRLERNLIFHNDFLISFFYDIETVGRLVDNISHAWLINACLSLHHFPFQLSPCPLCLSYSTTRA